MHDDPDLFDLITDVRDLLSAVAAVGSFVFLSSLLLPACTKEQQAQVKTVLQAADKGGQLGCVLFPALPVPVPGEAREVVEDVCLGADEVRQAIADYQRGKAARKAAASASSAAPSAPPSASIWAVRPAYSINAPLPPASSSPLAAPSASSAPPRGSAR